MLQAMTLVQDRKMPADHFQVKLSGNWKDVSSCTVQIKPAVFSIRLLDSEVLHQLHICLTGLFGQ